MGTIVSDASMAVKWQSGGTLGHIEEGFIARLNKGDHFVFAGRVLEYVRTQDMAAYVRFLLGRGTVDGKVLLPAAALERMRALYREKGYYQALLRSAVEPAGERRPQQREQAQGRNHRGASGA